VCVLLNACAQIGLQKTCAHETGCIFIAFAAIETLAFFLERIFTIFLCVGLANYLTRVKRVFVFISESVFQLSLRPLRENVNGRLLSIYNRLLQKSSYFC
jgi:hypothetical protein